MLLHLFMERTPVRFYITRKKGARDHLFHCLEAGKLHLILTKKRRRGEEEIRKSNLLTQLKFVVTVDTTNFWMCDDDVQYLQRVVSHRSLCFCITECYRITFKVVL